MNLCEQIPNKSASGSSLCLYSCFCFWVLLAEHWSCTGSPWLICACTTCTLSVHTLNFTMVCTLDFTTWWHGSLQRTYAPYGAIGWNIQSLSSSPWPLVHWQVWSWIDVEEKWLNETGLFEFNIEPGSLCISANATLSETYCPSLGSRCWILISLSTQSQGKNGTGSPERDPLFQANAQTWRL